MKIPVVVIAFPVYLHVTTGIFIHPRGIPWSSHFWSMWGEFRTNTAQIAFSFVFLPHQAYLMCDAITCTLYRQLISHRKLLEWVSAAEAERSVRYDISSYLRLLWPAEILALVALGLTIIFKPDALVLMIALGQQTWVCCCWLPRRRANSVISVPWNWLNDRNSLSQRSRS